MCDVGSRRLEINDKPRSEMLSFIHTNPKLVDELIQGDRCVRILNAADA